MLYMSVDWNGKQNRLNMDETWMGIVERIVNYIMLQAVKDLCLLGKVPRLRRGSKNENVSRRAPIYTTLNMITPRLHKSF